MGKEEKPDPPERLVFQIDESIEDLVQKLRQNNFPCSFQPVPTESEIEIYSQTGSIALEDFLNESR